VKKIQKVLPFLLAVVLCVLAAGCPALLTASSSTDAGTLNLYGGDPITLDPAVVGEATSGEYVMSIFSGLACLGDDLQPAPDIARDWQVSGDGLTYTFYLRDDAKFQDGRAVEAGDFKYAWERACNPATGSRTAATYLGDIVGVADVLAGKTAEISGVQVIDDATLRVTIDAPKSYFLSKLTYPTAFVVDKSNVEEGSGWWRQPNGTGPFRLKSWDAGSQLVLEKNALYYGAAAKLDRVVFYLSGMPMNMYETGQIDVVSVGADYIDRVTDKSGSFASQLAASPELSFGYIGFNMTEPPFDDANVRRAFSRAVDKDKIISLVLRDLVQRADGILPPGIPGYNEELAGLGYDVAAAKELIAASKYGSAANLPPITITVSGVGGTISQDLEAIIDQWRTNLGVEVAVRQLESNWFIYHLKEEKDQLYYLGWIADYPHPQDFLDILFRTGEANNAGEYSSAEVDRLLDEAAVATDSARSLALYGQVEQMLVDDAACLPLWFGENTYLVKPYVEGYSLNAMGMAPLNKVTVKAH
jgi:oligopeptide transport system substrate-binding protein